MGRSVIEVFKGCWELRKNSQQPDSWLEWFQNVWQKHKLDKQGNMETADNCVGNLWLISAPCPPGLKSELLINAWRCVSCSLTDLRFVFACLASEISRNRSMLFNTFTPWYLHNIEEPKPWVAELEMFKNPSYHKSRLVNRENMNWIFFLSQKQTQSKCGLFLFHYLKKDKYGFLYAREKKCHFLQQGEEFETITHSNSENTVEQVLLDCKSNQH